MNPQHGVYDVSDRFYFAREVCCHSYQVERAGIRGVRRLCGIRASGCAQSMTGNGGGGKTRGVGRRRRAGMARHGAGCGTRISPSIRGARSAAQRRRWSTTASRCATAGRATRRTCGRCAGRATTGGIYETGTISHRDGQHGVGLGACESLRPRAAKTAPPSRRGQARNAG